MRPTRGFSDPHLKSGYATTRRGLISASALLASVIGSKAFAMGRVPKDGAHPCFLAGTKIRTPDGERDITSLKAGDLVVTISGEAKPIKSVTRTRYERASRERWAAEILPVKVARSALGPLNPRADLFLSPAHALYLNGLMVPVGALINGRSITRCAALDSDSIEYFHIELDRHDAIFAEGTPVETLLDFSALTESDSFAPRIPTDWRAAVRSRLRSAASPLIDRRRPFDHLWERIAERAESGIAA